VEAGIFVETYVMEVRERSGCCGCRGKKGPETGGSLLGVECELGARPEALFRVECELGEGPRLSLLGVECEAQGKARGSRLGVECELTGISSSLFT